MSHLIGGKCNGCDYVFADCRCQRETYLCEKGHSVEIRVSWGGGRPPKHCQLCYEEWLSTTFPMKKETY